MGFGENIKIASLKFMNQKNEETDEIEEIEELDSIDSEDDSIDSEEIEFEGNPEEDEDSEDKVDNEPEATRAIVIPLTQTQYEVVMLAIQHIKDQFDYPIYDGKAIELICGEFLSGVKHE